MRAVATAVLAALAAGPGAAKQPAATIRYETSACFGACPAFVVAVGSDGRGSFTGLGHTAARGERAFTVTPARFAAFRARLRPVRATGEVLIEPGRPLCRSAATDQVTIDVRWREPGRPDRHLRYYRGCDMGRHRDLDRALVGAWRVLGIDALVGAQPR